VSPISGHLCAKSKPHRCIVEQFWMKKSENMPVCLSKMVLAQYFR
jgi:hypothetical protein